MCLEKVYVGAAIREKLRSGPLGWLIDGFCRWLLQRGAARRTVQEHVSRVDYLCRGLEQAVTRLQAGEPRLLLSGLAQHAERADTARGRRRERSTVHRFGQFLDNEGLRVSEPEVKQPYEAVLSAYLDWLRTMRENKAATIALRRFHGVRFLESLGELGTFEGLASVNADLVWCYAIEATHERSRSVRSTILTGLRAFLEFCYCAGHTPGDLRPAVPRMRSYRLSDTPRGLGDEDARAVLRAVDKDCRTGKRDYAMLQVLYTYGVRGVQVRRLRLEDIDWRNDRIFFRPVKHGKGSLLPLTDEVGDALLGYLRDQRPEVSYPEVFMTGLAPFHPLWDSAALSHVARRWIERAGVDTPARGSHAFRHGFASTLVNKGCSLKAIADVLGHRRLASTFIYTKVDFRNLETVALEWPEVGE